MSRVYASLNIDQLEKQFQASKDNVENLQSLDYELKHRKSRRAKQLRTETLRRVSELNDETPEDDFWRLQT